MDTTAPAPQAVGDTSGAWMARLRGWLYARLPATDTWTLGQRNVYILPTKAGFTFAGTLLIMVLASINYQLNLGFALTFLLLGAAIVSMHQTHANLRGLTLHLRPAASVHAGDMALLDVVITNPGRVRLGLALRFAEHDLRRPGRRFAFIDATAQGQTTAQLSLHPMQRGWHAVPPLTLETVFPFGLFRAWTVWRPALRVLAWPQPEAGAPPLPTAAAEAGDERSSRHASGSQWDGVRPWRRGDTLRQVVWKKVARSGQLVSRETAGHQRRDAWVDWAETSGNTEQRLSRLTAWALQAAADHRRWGLRLPGQDTPPGEGEAHLRSVLDTLALWR